MLSVKNLYLLIGYKTIKLSIMKSCDTVPWTPFHQHVSLVSTVIASGFCPRYAPACWVHMLSFHVKTAAMRPPSLSRLSCSSPLRRIFTVQLKIRKTEMREGLHTLTHGHTETSRAFFMHMLMTRLRDSGHT
jgi:hypothetical protein